MAIDYYQKVADSYDRQWKTYTDKTLSQVDKYLPDLTGMTILDHGCGTGELIWKMLTHSPGLAQVIGYDPSAAMLQQAENKLRLLPDDLQQKTSLQCENKYDTSFDLIVSTSVLHYLPKPQAVLTHWRSLLQPGGPVILLDYSKAGWLPRYFEWAIRLIDQAHHQAYCPAQARTMIEGAGFEIDRSETFMINHFWQGFIIKASVPR